MFCSSFEFYNFIIQNNEVLEDIFCSYHHINLLLTSVSTATLGIFSFSTIYFMYSLQKYLKQKSLDESGDIDKYKVLMQNIDEKDSSHFCFEKLKTIYDAKILSNRMKINAYLKLLDKMTS